MNAENVTSIKDPVKATIREVISWMESMGKANRYRATTVRNETTALRQIVSVDGQGENLLASKVLDDFDDLLQRWAIANPGKTSGSTYKTRASQLLHDYFRWAADPSNFKGRAVKPIKSPPAKAKTAKVKVEISAEASAESPGAAASHGSNPALQTYKIPGTNKSFTFGFSEQPNMSDILPILFHLSSITADFDPAAVAQTIMNMRSSREISSTAIDRSND